MKIAVEGCCHGELDKIYETISFLEKKQGVKVDLLLCCGDFQAVRNPSDLNSMAVPPKYQKMNTFYKYYSGEKKAPILTIFIGGNHEASNYLQELPYGGWVAPNIYYMGYAGVLQIGGVRIGGLSGIYKGKDYMKGRFEHVPYTEDTKRSVYHIRNLDVFRLKQVSRHVDIFLTHDWPTGVYHHGNYQQLARFKPYFAKEMEDNTLGSPPAAELLHTLQPSYWFSAHLHCKFAALVKHESADAAPKETRFLALDKCLPKRRFLQLLDVPHDTSKALKLELDPEWLCVLKSTNHLLKTTPTTCYMPGPGWKDRYDFTVTDEEISELKQDFNRNLTVPERFEPTVDPYHPTFGPARADLAPPPRITINPHTKLLCDMLEITDPNTHFLKDNPMSSSSLDFAAAEANPDEIPLEDDESSGSSDEDGESDDDPNGTAEEPSYDTFIISQDASSLGLSSSVLEESVNESVDEKYVTAVQSMSDLSQDESVLGVAAESSEVSESLSQESSSSPPRGMLSPPATSGEEQVGSSSDKDSSTYLCTAPTTERVSPKRPHDIESTPTFCSTPKDADSQVKPRKFKRRNQSFYASTD